MLSLTLSDTDTFKFLSAVVKGGEVYLPDLLRKTIGNTLLPDTDFKRQEGRGAAEHENVERPDIAQLFRPICAIDEKDLIGNLPQNTPYFIIAGVAGVAQAYR